MPKNYCKQDDDVMILACSGGSNVGQLTNRASVELTQEGFGNMYCTAGIGGRLDGFVKSAKDVSKLVAVDGCSIGCAKAILKNANVPLENHLVLTDLGIEKNKDLNLKTDEIESVKNSIKEVFDKK